MFRPLLVVLLTVLAVGCAGGIHVRSKRQSVTEIFDAARCGIKLPAISSQCNADLDERTKALREADIGGDAGTCCYFAAYRQCVKSKAQTECGDGAANAVDSFIRGVQGMLVDKCSAYDFFTPSCLFVLYYPWLIIGAIVLALVAIGCCLGSCCC